MYNIHLLPASFGDAILIEYGEAEPHYILIDGGPYFMFDEVMAALKPFNIKTIELLIVTHIDIDHIDGTIRLLNTDPLPFKIEEVWYNGFAQLPKAKDILGAAQGEYLSELIKKKRIPHNIAFDTAAVKVEDANHPKEIQLQGGMQITLLSPTEAALKALAPVWRKEIAKIGTAVDFAERLRTDRRYRELSPDLMGGEPKEHVDDSPANRSSIAFIGSYEGKRCLFAGDSPTAELLPAIEHLLTIEGGNRLRLDAWKLAHHGSRRSTQASLMEKIDCKQILVSTDGKRFQHPDAECIDNVVKINGPKVHLHFNYTSGFNKPWADEEQKKAQHFQSHYPPNGSGITLRL
jgi:beta-lactamase superfamily II metal-dependent hydrolase